jgi:hypothetical protein
MLNVVVAFLQLRLAISKLAHSILYFNLTERANLLRVSDGSRHFLQQCIKAVVDFQRALKILISLNV